MSIDILKNQLGEKNISGAYIFTGKEDYLKKFYINKIKSAMGISESDPFNYLSVSADSISGITVDDYCKSAPVFAEKKLLYISCFDTDLASADVTDVFNELEKSFPEWCVIICEEQSTEKPTSKSFAAAMKKCLAKNSLTVDIPLGNQAELSNWILRHAKAENVQMDRENALYLLSVTDNNMYNLSNEMSKLFACSKTVDKALIDKMVIKTIDAGIFDLTDAILKKQVAKALEIFNELYLKHPDVLIMGTIYGCFTGMYMIAILNRKGHSQSEIAAVTQMSPYAVGKNLRLLQAIDIQTLKSIITVCSEFDDGLKRHTRDKKREMEIFILRLINMLEK